MFFIESWKYQHGIVYNKVFMINEFRQTNDQHILLENHFNPKIIHNQLKLLISKSLARIWVCY